MVQDQATRPHLAQPADGALIVAQAAAVARVRAQVEARVRQLWRRQPNYRDPAAFVASVVPVVQAGQVQTAAITAAYLSQMYGRLTGQPVKMLGAARDKVTSLRAGTTPAEVYARPFHLVWRDLATAQDARDAHYNWTAPTKDEPERPPLPPADYVQQAIQHGEDRAVDLAATDVQLAKQHAALQVMGHQDKVVGYRRVLEGAYSCGLCIVAATNLYHKADLLPIHPACDCSVEPVLGDDWDSAERAAMVRNADGRLVKVADLPDVHDRIAETFGKDSAAARAIGVRGELGPRHGGGKRINYRDAIITHSNGELGPVLAVRGQSFRGPRDIAKHVSPTTS